MCETLLLLFHGQTSVERVFSVNKQMKVKNMHEDTYTSLYEIYDHVKTVINNKPFLSSEASTHQRYLANVGEKKQEK